ncbi:hypothetical protein ACFFX0_16940 [Citricoccus parietis]|uniref:Uncharacterized protein n=1 Tax=Citricoccus parietis TaxID=592307 RepID=A0ABV5G2U1_9MICC
MAGTSGIGAYNHGYKPCGQAVDNSEEHGLQVASMTLLVLDHHP